MSGHDKKDFDDRLAELNNWQIEQQKKLKAFQEAQKKLLDLEHQTVLNGLSTHKFSQITHNKSNAGIPNLLLKGNESEDISNFNAKEANGIFHLKFPQIRLTESKSSLFTRQGCSSEAEKINHFCSESVENMEESNINKPRKFLKRGEGLARFRMTLDDFKGPPKIYKEKRIKTYLNNKPDPKKNKGNIKIVKNNNKCSRNLAPKPSAKPACLPVKIYMPENKTKPCNSAKSFESKQISQSCKNLHQFYPKSPIQDLSLKPHAIATEWYKALKEKEKADFSNKNNTESQNNSAVESDIENKKDEKELRIFEILERKVDDTSFCSTSSFVEKLMEQSISSTPSSHCTKSKDLLSYAQGLKSLRSQFLDEEQIKRFEELDEIPFEKNVIPTERKFEIDTSNREGITPETSIKEKEAEDKHISEKEETRESFDQKSEVLEDMTSKIKELDLQPQKVNKTLLQEYIKDFKKFKFLLSENVHKIEEELETEPPEKDLVTEEKEEQPNQHEIALKLQRKGLQDNVKQLLNWECPPRKRPTKRVVKKGKAKSKLEKSKSVSKEQSEKIIFNSALLYERLNELEKEIEIFRKENKNLEKLQKECSEERVKLSKERKDFEKQMQEEREKLEGKIIEEQKKLQKEKMVFEKYYKQVKNQPTRQEREEIAKLKKEVEKLTETLTTKEARWGASQARLRNQIKNLEKENAQLKAEIEKYKKLSAKKVSFENERNLSTKIIHAINSELGKLKPVVIKDTNGPGIKRNQSLSARVERELGEKPIRRIKSAPNVKKQIELDICTEIFNECDEKALGSVSTDSGIETNGSRYATMQREKNVSFYDSKISKEVENEESLKESSCRSPLFEQTEECGTAQKFEESAKESAVREAIFEDDMDATNRKIAEVKNRLERLTLLEHLEEDMENDPIKMVRLPSSRRDIESVEESLSSEEDETEEEVRKNDLEIINCPLKKGLGNKADSYIGSYSRKNVIESKLDENGIWEKLFEDGSKEISFPNGNVKKIFPGSKIVKMTYYNGDIKETNIVEGSEKYYYAETKTWHTTYKDGLEVLEFPNGQTERRHADGSTEISFPNGCVRYCDPSGKDEWRFLDGTVIKTNECGHKILLMPNGQKEIHTKEFKKREYPDGTVKILYSDGTQETRYSNGRVRLKDKDGNLVMDSGGIT